MEVEGFLNGCDQSLVAIGFFNHCFPESNQTFFEFFCFSLSSYGFIHNQVNFTDIAVIATFQGAGAVGVVTARFLNQKGFYGNDFLIDIVRHGLYFQSTIVDWDGTRIIFHGVSNRRIDYFRSLENSGYRFVHALIQFGQDFDDILRYV